MIFSPSEEQQLILQSLEKLCQRFRTPALHEVVQPHLYSASLRTELVDAGFLDIGVDDPSSAGSSALVVAELTKLPVAAELTASALVRPAICPGIEGPIALIQGDPLTPTRFLSVAQHALVIDDVGIGLLKIESDDVKERESLFAYPIGQLRKAAVGRILPLDPALRETALRWWRIGTTLEIYGALDSAMAVTLDHVRERQQFGRPLGAFQAVQHRLAMSATAIQATRWLGMSAIFNEVPARASLALGYGQDIARTVAYDLHQFSGAMGLTLEYPLHLYTYRTKWLQAELGGARRQFATAGDQIWSGDAIDGLAVGSSCSTGALA